MEAFFLIFPGLLAAFAIEKIVNYFFKSKPVSKEEYEKQKEEE